ncbi:hypothetical protein LZ11_02497, partial [Thermosediminibacter litoriperuensis]
MTKAELLKKLIEKFEQMEFDEDIENIYQFLDGFLSELESAEGAEISTFDLTVLALLLNKKFGLKEIKKEIKDIEKKLDDKDFGLEEIKKEIKEIEKKLDDDKFGLKEIKKEIKDIEDKLDNKDFG